MVRTRSSAAAGEIVAACPQPDPVPSVKRRGRPPTKKPALSTESSASPTPLAYSSASEYSTPLTSNVATPVPAEVPLTVSNKRIEVVLPTRRIRAGRPSKASIDDPYSLAPKRKRDVIEDSEEDLSDYAPDAKLARKLQDEEDAAAAKCATFSLDAEASIFGPTRRREPPRRFGTKKVDSPPSQINGTRVGVERIAIIPDSADDDDDDEDDDFEEVDSDDSLPLAKSRAARVPAGPIRDYDLNVGGSGTSDDDFDDTAGGVSDDDGSNIASEAGSTAVASTANRGNAGIRAAMANRRAYRSYASSRRVRNDRARLEKNHPELKTMWEDLKNMPILKAGKAEQPTSISRQLKPFQLEGLAWMKEMEKTEWKGGLLGDEMGLGKTIQAVSLIMSDFPQKKPTLVLVPPVALMQWMTEIESYTDGTLKTLVFHGTNSKSKNLTMKDIKKYHVIIMSYNSLESVFRKQEKGFKRKEGIYKEKSVIHQTEFHRIILDEAHSIKTRTTMTAKACFALKVTYRWCLSGTPLQNRIGEFFSLIRFLNVRPFACYLCKQCPCKTMEWSMDEDSCCTQCKHGGMRHVSVFNQELLNPIQKYGNQGQGAEALKKLRILTDRIMLRRLKKDHTDSMELPVKEINVERQFFGEAENDFANSIMTNGQRKFDTYVATGVLLNNYANIFGLIMQMRQVADHPDLILKKNSDGGQNILVCGICDETAEDAIRSRCKHDFCRTCVKSYLNSSEEPNCPQCHIPLSIDLEQPEIEQDEAMVKKSSIINRIKMENWTSSSKIELLVHELHKLRSDNASHKSIIFSQFTTMLQLIEWRLRRAGITTVMLDGSMTPAQRQASIQHFMTNPDVECFLVSLKAGGVALNLTEASRVFIVDPWWNPAAEWQSADRCHRIGQTRPCTITRLCIEDSVESRMVLLQEKKTNMINSTINSDDAAMDSLSPEDLQFLFRGS
ncbi:putative DNA repair protein [Triangularia setosa]|uniref:DNA repair protein n=1 Tax=Triangularia setosa TaxID=2587417 RepID=A0AAN6W915_9PEZI|nr:putative DNA repair protein [Podospora setosa]